MKLSFPLQRRGWVLLVFFPLVSAPSRQVPALPGLRVVLTHPDRVYTPTDTVEVVLQNSGLNVLHVTASTALVTNLAPSRRPALLAANVSQTPSMVQVMATPPCLRLAAASRTTERWPVRQVLGYSLTPAQAIQMAGGSVIRISFTFKQCGQNTRYTPPWTLQVRL